MDTLCKVMTVLVFILFLALAQRSIRVIFLAQGNGTIILMHVGILILYISILLFSYLYAPQSYTLTDKELSINRPAKNKSIPIEEITEVRLPISSDFLGTIRTFGVGGLFGYYGKYYNSRIGSMTWYVTQRKNRILIRTKKEEKIIISPDDISLLDALQNKVRK